MNDDQLLRYSRQIMLPQADIKGQELLLKARVVILGLGGLGCPAAQYLAGAGVGELMLVDPDTVDISNVHRQILYSSEDIGFPKVEAASRRLTMINPDCKADYFHGVLEEEALMDEVRKATVVLDCTDNFGSRFAINKACVSLHKPLVSGSAIGLSGQLAVYDRRMRESPCYRCLYDESNNAELSCSESGVLGPVVGSIGTLQALEAIKLIIGFGQSLSGRLMIFDGAKFDWQQLALEADPDCPVCSGND